MSSPQRGYTTQNEPQQYPRGQYHMEQFNKEHDEHRQFLVTQTPRKEPLCQQVWDTLGKHAKVLEGMESTTKKPSEAASVTPRHSFKSKPTTRPPYNCASSPFNMQLIKQAIERDGSGSVTLQPEEQEDMWYAYNLIQPTDLLRASAIRRVTTDSATGPNASQRVHLTLLIRVRALDFDPQAAALHVSGQIVNETPHTRVGQFHTLDLELHRPFTLEKAEGWDSVAREVVREACAGGAKRVGAWAVVMQEGKAAVVGLGAERTVVRGRVDVSVPGKGRAGHEKGLEKFFQVTMETMLRHVDLAEALPILLASPGFTAAAFLKYVNETAVRTGDRALMAQRANFIVVHSSSGHVHALNEVLQGAEVQARLKDTRYARETRLMEEFMALLRKDDGRVWYGPREVERAVEKGAVGRGGGVLLISNGLFRAQDVAVRRRWVTLVDKVKDEEGGEVRVLSSEHESGKRLEGLGGIAAILTFPLEDLDEDEVEEAVPDGTLDIDAQTTEI